MHPDYWSHRYQALNVPWDIGFASPPLTAFLQRLTDRNQRILIPGAGNAYEAEWLWQQGFSNVYVIDVAQEPLLSLRERCPGFPEDQLLQRDFFELQQGFDLILEQTFFCALPPTLRGDYVRKMKELLHLGGHLVGVLFDFPLTEQGPPFGGSREEYRGRFQDEFRIIKLERCYNSIPSRRGKELFLHLVL